MSSGVKQLEQAWLAALVLGVVCCTSAIFGCRATTSFACKIGSCGTGSKLCESACVAGRDLTRAAAAARSPARFATCQATAASILTCPKMDVENGALSCMELREQHRAKGRRLSSARDHDDHFRSRDYEQQIALHAPLCPDSFCCDSSNRVLRCTPSAEVVWSSGTAEVSGRRFAPDDQRRHPSLGTPQNARIDRHVFALRGARSGPRPGRISARAA